VTSAALAGALCLATGSASAYCPSYTLSSTANSYNCGVEAANGVNPTLSEWQQIFDTVAKGPPVWGSQGPSVSDIGQGCGKPEPLHNVPALFPCEVLKAIAMAESGWTQFCVPDQPADQVGGPSRTIISFDCGYGVGQVTSGMHKGETPSFSRDRVAAEPLYNMATGASILASKWKATQCVGDNQPSLVEDWYSAVWAYNGLSYKNNPNNPTYSSTRGVYDPKVGAAAPYQEKVFGRIEHPSGTPAYWPSVALAYPDPADIGGSNAPPELPEPTCASPTDCTSTRSVHPSNCFASGTGGSAGAAGSGNGGAAGSGGAAGGGGAPWTGGTAGSGIDAGSFGGSAGANVQPQSNVDGGCSCRQAKPNESRSLAGLLALLLVLAAARASKKWAHPRFLP
jgi:hypothetical protein